eukprot:scaffold44024_cov42-Phaeocystis_antarctica.AAC.1
MRWYSCLGIAGTRRLYTRPPCQLYMVSSATAIPRQVCWKRAHEVYARPVVGDYAHAALYKQCVYVVRMHRGSRSARDGQ